MTFWKPEKSIVFMFKDLCRTAIEGLHIFEYNISLFRRETENQNFIDELQILSTKIKLENEKEHFEKLKSGYYIR
ncbi:MAG: hypothetical protein LC112_15995 [Flavobacteriales bacterium]|nr:hypothetical protein [Flavobacteriales bacterium]